MAELSLTKKRATERAVGSSVSHDPPTTAQKRVPVKLQPGSEMLSCAFFPCLYVKSLNQTLKVKKKEYKGNW